MTGDKQKRLIKAAISSACVLLFMLCYIVVNQLITITVKKQKMDELSAEITRLEQLIESTDDEIESWSYRWKIEEKAREYGYRYKD